MRKIHDDSRALCYEVILRIGGYVAFGAIELEFETKIDAIDFLIALSRGFDRLQGYHRPSSEPGEAQTIW
jgi:hypothetical protein